MQTRVRKIVTGGVFFALIIVLGISGLGFIPLPAGAAITILQAPVIIAAILEGPIVGFCTGLLFGIFSVIQASMAAVTPFDMAFIQYPWIAIVPRILIGPAAWLMYFLISGSFHKEKPIPPVREITAVITGAVTGSMINTILVLSGLTMALPEILNWPIVIKLISFNGIIEACFSAGISLAVILPWKGISTRKKSKLNRKTII